MIALKRAYEPPAKSDGRRVLVDRLWPRGVSKARARIDDWERDIAPSTELRKWFSHRPDRWIEFQQRYHAELRGKSTELQALKRSARKLTLIYGAQDSAHAHALVLKEMLAKR